MRGSGVRLLLARAVEVVEEQRDPKASVNKLKCEIENSSFFGVVVFSLICFQKLSAKFSDVYHQVLEKGGVEGRGQTPRAHFWTNSATQRNQVQSLTEKVTRETVLVTVIHLMKVPSFRC